MGHDCCAASRTMQTGLSGLRTINDSCQGFDPRTPSASTQSCRHPGESICGRHTKSDQKRCSLATRGTRSCFSSQPGRHGT